MITEKTIDVVITWVDGRDPLHRKKMSAYVKETETAHEDVAAPTRFFSEGEIYYCVASILRFAPFVRKIFIITDEQNPDLVPFININFPDNRIPVVVVDHRVIFREYEAYLPTFNSLSIETCLFRIPGLAENFVYFNDDFFLIREIKPTDWFQNDKPVAYGSMRSVQFDSFLRKIKPKKNGRKPFGFKDSMLNAAQVLNIHSSYFCIGHTPLPMKKSILEAYFPINPEIFISNIAYKFRNENQFNPQALFYLLALNDTMCIPVKENKLLFIKPAKKTSDYIARKIKTFQRNENVLFVFVESVDMAAIDVRDRLFGWLKSLINIKSVAQ